MKFSLTLITLLAASLGLAANKAEGSRDLLAHALQYPLVMQKVAELEGAEIIGLRQIFIRMGRGSHNELEISYGVPDGTGGYRDSACVALKVNAGDTVPGHRGQAELQPSSDSCHAPLSE